MPETPDRPTLRYQQRHFGGGVAGGEVVVVRVASSIRVDDEAPTDVAGSAQCRPPSVNTAA